MAVSNLKIEATRSTPEVILNSDLGIIKFTGTCRPLNAEEFFTPIFQWANEYSDVAKPTTLVYFDLFSIQGASQKYLLIINRELSKILKRKGFIYFIFLTDGQDDILTDVFTTLGFFKGRTVYYLLRNEYFINSEQIVQLISKFSKNYESIEYLNAVFENSLGYYQIVNDKLVYLKLVGLNCDILPKVLFEIDTLKELIIACSLISVIPSGISKLKNLKKLEFISNKNLRVLPEEILNLELDFIDNQRNHGIYIDDDRLESPPIEIIHRGRTAVYSYFQSLHDEKILINELKVILLGEGSAGKTSLVKRLIGEKFDPNETQTHGILLKNWYFSNEGTNIVVNIWDFGGQEIMHSTHQFFLTKRTIYILVLDSRKDEKSEYWLKLIRSYAGPSPVIVVINKIDENPGFELEYNLLKKKYPNIIDFYKVSCKTNDGVDNLRKATIDAISGNEFLRIKWARSWVEIKNKLEVSHYQSLTKDDFLKVCYSYCVFNEDEITTIIDLLNDLGVVVHFDEFFLTHMFIIDPVWITTAVYKIINSKFLSEKKGRLKLALLHNIFKENSSSTFNYPTQSYLYIINLMKKFELCFSIDDETVLIPDLLPIEGRNSFDPFEFSTHMFLQYDFLPHSILPRFIVRMHNDIPGFFEMWRTGVSLYDEDTKTKALIYADYDSNRIYIFLAGDSISDYLPVLLFTFNNLKGSPSEAPFKTMIMMPDNHGISVSYEHLLFLMNEKGIEEYYPDGSKRSYRIDQLLGRIHKNRDSNEEILKLLNKILEVSSETPKTIDRLNEIIEIKPNFMGIGLNFNSLINLIKKKNSQ